MGVKLSKSCFPRKQRNKIPNKEEIILQNNGKLYKSKEKPSIQSNNDNLYNYEEKPPIQPNNEKLYKYEVSHEQLCDNTNFQKTPINQNLLNNKLSYSEINLLKQLREAKVNFPRPKGIECPRFIRNKPIIRISSWNVNGLTVSKLQNAGILSVVCLTILENNLSIITLQEVINKDVAQLICNELNNSSFPNIKSHQNSCNWDYVVSDESIGKTFQGKEFGVIIFDKSKNVECLQSSTLNLNSSLKSFSRKPFLVNIKIDTSVYLFVVFHIKACTFTDKIKSSSKVVDEINDISILAIALKETLKPGHKVIMMGDFNENPKEKCFQALRNENYMYCIDSNLSTNTSKTNGKSYDNVWINKACEGHYTGRSGVIRDGLNHAHIPKFGLTGWGGYISDHCPIYVDFFIRL